MPNNTVTIHGIIVQVPEGHEDFDGQYFHICFSLKHRELVSVYDIFSLGWEDGEDNFYKYQQRRCVEAARIHFINVKDAAYIAQRKADQDNRSCAVCEEFHDLRISCDRMEAIMDKLQNASIQDYNWRRIGEKSK